MYLTRWSHCLSPITTSSSWVRSFTSSCEYLTTNMRSIIEIYSVHFIHLMFSPSEGCPVLLVAAIVAPEQHNPQPVAALQPQLAISLLPPRLSLSVKDS